MPKLRPGPFVVSVRDVAYHPGEMRARQWQAAVPEKWGEGLVAVAKGESIDIQARFESVHEGILVTAEVDTRYTGECGRCLAPVAEPVQVEFQELFAYSSSEATDWVVQDDHVDLESPVRDAIVLSLPFQPVCQLDCSGLDPLRGEPAGAGSGLLIDPRWAALQDFAETPGRSSLGGPETEES